LRSKNLLDWWNFYIEVANHFGNYRLTETLPTPLILKTDHQGQDDIPYR